MTDKLVPVAGFEGDDDHATIVVGKVVPDPVPREPSDVAARSARAFAAVRKGVLADLDAPGGFQNDLTQEDIEELVGAHTPEPSAAAAASARNFATVRDYDLLARKDIRARLSGLGDDVNPPSRGDDDRPPLVPRAPLTANVTGRTPIDKTDAWDERNPDADRMKEALGQGADGGGLRLNAGKNRIELLPETWIWALADVMTQGSKKYDARNWEKGMDWSAMIGCMHRHLAKFQAGKRYDGEKFDKEAGTTGCHELAMVAWNALALMHYDLTETGTNDLVPQQLDLFSRVNAETSDLGERHGKERT